MDSGYFQIFFILLEPPFNVSQFKVFTCLMLNFSDPKPFILVFNLLHLIFSSSYCSDQLLPEETLNTGFIVSVGFNYL
jgi:hypothetical protein